MPSLALLFHLIEGGAVQGNVVGVESALMAVSLCEYLEAHAKRVYAGAINPTLRAAHALAARIEKGEVRDGDPVRNLYRNQWGFLSTPEAVKAALDVLEKHGWVKTGVVRTGGRGNPAKIVKLHPELRT